MKSNIEVFEINFFSHHKRYQALNKERRNCRKYPLYYFILFFGKVLLGNIFTLLLGICHIQKNIFSSNFFEKCIYYGPYNFCKIRFQVVYSHVTTLLVLFLFQYLWTRGRVNLLFSWRDTPHIWCTNISSFFFLEIFVSSLIF